MQKTQKERLHLWTLSLLDTQVLSKSKGIVLNDTDLNGKTSHRCFQDDLSSLRSPLDMKKQSVFSSIWIQVNTFKIVFWLNAALGFWRLRSKGILVGRWSVKQRKHSVTRHWDNRLSRNIQGHHLRGTAQWATSWFGIDKIIRALIVCQHYSRVMKACYNDSKIRIKV